MNFMDSNSSSRLSFEPKEFHADNFSVDEFIQRKRHSVPLDVLRDDLGAHLKFLRSALIELINQDYGQFVNLSSNLVGLDGRIQNIVGPLQRAQNDLQAMHERLTSTLSSLREELEKRKAVREAKSQLQFLRMANTTLESSEKYMKKVPSEILTSTDFNLLMTTCDEIAETRFLLQKCCSSPLRDQLQTKCDILCNEILNKLNDLLQIYAEVDADVMNASTSDTSSKNQKEDVVVSQTSESEAEKIVKSLLYMYSELQCELKAEEVFILKILKPKCEVILSRKGNINALLDEMEKFVNHSPVLKVSRKLVELPWMVKYDFITRGVFAQVMSILGKNFPHIWSAASPDSFHTNWTRCEAFVHALEAAMPSLNHLRAFRQSELFKEFISKWQFLVYYQLRFHGLAVELESSLDALSTPCVTTDFKLDATRVMIKLLNQCWDKDKIFIAHISGRFIKASALFVSRYIREIKTEIASNKQAQMSLLISAYCDLNLAELVVRQILTKKLKELKFLSDEDDISSSSNSVASNNSQSSPALLFLNGFQWADTRDAIEIRLVDVTVGQSASSISAVTEVPRLFRRTNRAVPTNHGEYVEAILQPIITLRNDMKSAYQTDLWEKVGSKIGTQILNRYLSQVQEVLTSVQRMEESLKRLKKVKGQNQNSISSGGAENKVLSDDDKIRLQIQIDVKHFATQIKEICPFVDTTAIENLLEKLMSKS